MPYNVILRPFRGEDDYPRLAVILTASQKADCLPVTVSPSDLAENLSRAPRFDLFRDQVIPRGGWAGGWLSGACAGGKNPPAGLTG